MEIDGIEQHVTAPFANPPMKAHQQAVSGSDLRQQAWFPL